MRWPQKLHRHMKKIAFILAIITLLIGGWLYFVKGYVGIRRRPAVPEALTYEAVIPGTKNIRVMIDPIKAQHTRMREIMYGSGLTSAKFTNPTVNVLAISGGGANSAYGAGILCGWTKAGKRPKFDIVTGVSTGALIAPAAIGSNRWAAESKRARQG